MPASTMSTDEAHWRVTLGERACELGFASLTELAAARPRATLIDLAEELGATGARTIVPIDHLHDFLVDEAVERGDLSRCARDLLVRGLRQQVDGWPTLVDHAGRTSLGACLLGWAASLGARVPDARRPALDTALELLDLPVPAGWMAEHPDDEPLITVFGHHWPG